MKLEFITGWRDCHLQKEMQSHVLPKMECNYKSTEWGVGRTRRRSKGDFEIGTSIKVLWFVTTRVLFRMKLFQFEIFERPTVELKELYSSWGIQVVVFWVMTPSPPNRAQKTTTWIFIAATPSNFASCGTVRTVRLTNCSWVEGAKQE
jgi:hypothetical protein